MAGKLDGTIWALALVRFGQELGTDSELSRIIYDLIELLLEFSR
jgi:hypothetical protein